MIVRKLRRLPGHLRPRRLRIYSLGPGKSGTMTIARMFGRYRAAHEVDPERMLPLAVSVLEHELAVDSRRVRAELRRRSRRFHLEVDSAAFLNPFAGVLADLFVDARFVLALRDCFSWLDSRIEWDFRHSGSSVAMFEPIRNALYHDFPDEYAPEEAPLRDAGLRPVASYLRVWTRQNENVLRGVPGERLCVVRTEDLDRSADRLARFAGVAEGTVVPVHANQNVLRTGLLAGVPRDFVVARAQEHCAELMHAHWGSDWLELASRLPSADGVPRPDQA
jgi:hypothetical protein